MKKLLMIIALSIFVVPSLASASTGLNAQTYYQNNKAEWSLYVGNLWAIQMVDYVLPFGVRYQDVACSSVRNMCYVSNDLMRVFKFDITLFTKWQEEVTGKKVVFKPLFNVIR